MNNKSSRPQKIVHAHLPPEEPFLTTLTAGRHTLKADEHTSIKGGQDKGPDPYDYLLMALGSCSLMTVKMYADRKGWELSDIYMELRHFKKHAEDCEHCEKESAKLDFIEKELIIEGDLTQQQIDRMLEISQKCPVHRTLMSDIRIESSVTKKTS